MKKIHRGQNHGQFVLDELSGGGAGI